MFKRAFHVAITFGLLLACYAGYVRGFEIVAVRLSRNFEGTETKLVREPSKTETEARQLSRKILGVDHWTNDPQTQIYYNADRNFWMYFREFERINDGKQVDFRPFAVIWGSREGKGVKIATSETARVDLDKPLNDALKPGSTSLKIVHAKLERDVRFRDDKGTPDPIDDLKIGPFNSIEYDEAKLQITSDSEVIMEDRDLHLTGLGLIIQLRPREDTTIADGSTVANPGFNGAQTIIIKKNVFITLGDVGDDGILPNSSRPEQQKKGKTPAELRCDLAARFDLPKPGTPVKIGPPAPVGPTLAHFSRNVEVLRGVPDVPRDKLYCDNLHLTLYPGPKNEDAEEVALEAEAEIEAMVEDKPSAAPESGPLTELTLREAVADGHNVQLVSAANGLKARCNELIHKKQLPYAPDETYLRGDATTKVIVEKTDVVKEGPGKGKVTSYTHIKTIDAKIFDEGDGNDASTIVARGPGELETHPGLDKPVERRAKWNDQLTLQNIMVTEKADPKNPSAAPGQSVRKLITLTGKPSFDEIPSKTTLNAKSTLVLRLKPKGPVGEEDLVKDEQGKETFEIENLVALDDVNLISPGKTLHARKRLDAVFSPDPALVRTNATAEAKGKAGPPAPAGAAKPPLVKPVPDPADDAEIDPDTKKPKVPEKPPEPSATAIADRVWASIYLKPKPPGSTTPAETAPAEQSEGRLMGGQDAEIHKVYLRGTVAYHQDPAVGKIKGTDVTGQAIDLFSQGKNVHKFVVFHIDPTPSSLQKTASGANDKDKLTDTALEDLIPLAKVETEGQTIKGEVISLDQAANIATVDGRGSLSTMTAAGLLSEKTAANEEPEANQGLVALDPALIQAELADETKAKPKVPPKKKTPLTIIWKQGMKFMGSSAGPNGRSVAVAEFYDKVHAYTDEADMKCDDVMRTYMDKVVNLIEVKADPKNPADPDDPAKARADVALIECVQNVVIENCKFEPLTKEIAQKQRIRGNYVIYEKATGKFKVPGAGIVDLYERKGTETKVKVGQAGGADAKVIQVAGPAATPPLPRPNGEPAPVVGHGTTGRNFDVLSSDRPRTKGQKSGTIINRPKGLPVPPMILTTVKFKRQMYGRFGAGEQADKTETRWADFFGDVESIRGQVKTTNDVLDPDSPPIGAQFLTAQVLRVISEPPRDGGKVAGRYLLKAWENAFATIDDRTIQADTITFDSKEENFFAYGLEGRNVVIAQQSQQGQPGSVVDGRAAYYNHKTGASELMDPSKLALFDAKTGVRPRPEDSVKPLLKPVKPKRSQFRNPRQSSERKDFRGS